MIRQFRDHTCISLSLELNGHLTTPFPQMNKMLPESLSSIDDAKCTESVPKMGINKNNSLSSNSADTQYSELANSKDDVIKAQLPVEQHRCHNDGASMASGELNLIAAQLLDTLQKAVMKRVTLISDNHKHCEHQWTMCSQSKQQVFSKLSYGMAYNQATVLSDARVAILFSGGVDSMVLAALADRQVVMLVFHWLFLVEHYSYRCLPASESIDLINVAFQQKTQNR